MAQLDPFMKAMLDAPDSELLLTSDAAPRLVSRDGRARELMARTIASSKIRQLLSEIMPPEVRALIDERGSIEFTYAPAGMDTVRVAIRNWTGETAASCRAHRARAAGAAPPSTRDVAAPPSSRDVAPRSRQEAAPVSSRQEAPPSSRRDPVAPASRREERAPESAAVSASGGSAGVDERPIHALFRQMVAQGASDLHLTTGEPPMVRCDGEMQRLKGHALLKSDTMSKLLIPIMSERHRAEFDETHDTDFAYEIPGLSRFRCNVFRDRTGIGAVFRTIPTRIISADELGLSKAVQNLCYLSKGLVLVTGPTGSGKSTTLAAMVDLVNRERHDHIITIEDPIEFVHPSKSCLVNQREVGEHTVSFKAALRAALREDPDIVLVGEMRDLETVAIAIETAETGHLVFGTLHTTTAYSTIDRLIDQFPSDRQAQIRVMLSESLKGVVSQTLCKKIGGGRVAAMEVLLGTNAVANLIREGKSFQIPSIMQTSRKIGMQLMNDSLFDLVQAKKVEVKEAYIKAVDKANLGNMLKAAGHSLDFLGTLA